MERIFSLRLKNLLFLLLLNINFLGFSQNEIYNDIFYEVAEIYNFKHCILSITFDDGTQNQFQVAQPILNSRNIPATFYIVTNQLKDSLYRNIIVQADRHHHEIGSHTSNHLSLTDVDSLTLNYELINSKKDIDFLLGENKCLSFAYPGGHFNENVKNNVKKYYLSARTIVRGYNNIGSFNSYELKGMTYLRGLQKWQLKNIVKDASSKGLWLIEVFHGLQKMGYEPIDSIYFAEHLDYLKTKEQMIWFATISSVIKYSEELKNTYLECDTCSNDVYKIIVDDNLDDEIYNQPLSIKIRIPDNWDSVQICGAEFIKLEKRENNKFLFFNVTPHRGLVVIKPLFKSDINLQPELRFLNLSPNPFKDNVQVSFEVLNACSVMLTIENSEGHVLVCEKKIFHGNSVITTKFDLAKFQKGIFFLKIRIIDNINTPIIIKKLIKL